MLLYGADKRSCCPDDGMAACDEMPEFTEKQDLKEGIGWHAICTTAGGRCTQAWKRRNQGSREGVVPVVVEEE